MKTFIVVLDGKYRAEIGWLNRTWEDCVTACKSYGIRPSAHKVFVHGLSEFAVPLRFAKIREASQLEICIYEQDLARKKTVLSFPGDPDLELT